MGKKCLVYFSCLSGPMSQQTRYLETFQPVNRLMYSVLSQLYSNLPSGFLVERPHQVLLFLNLVQRDLLQRNGA